jgi:hypothetical protein
LVQLDEPSLLAPTCCCIAAALDPPWNLVQHSRIGAMSVDATALGAADLDGVAAFVDSGRTVLLGWSPPPPRRGSLSAEELAAAAAVKHVGVPICVTVGGRRRKGTLDTLW